MAVKYLDISMNLGALFMWGSIISGRTDAKVQLFRQVFFPVVCDSARITVSKGCLY